MIADAKSQATTEAEKIITSAKEQINIEKMKAMTEIKNQVADISKWLKKSHRTKGH